MNFVSAHLCPSSCVVLIVPRENIWVYLGYQPIFYFRWNVPDKYFLCLQSLGTRRDVQEIDSLFVFKCWEPCRDTKTEVRSCVRGFHVCSNSGHPLRWYKSGGPEVDFWSHVTANKQLCVTLDLVAVSLVLLADGRQQKSCCSAKTVQWDLKEVTWSALNLPLSDMWVSFPWNRPCRALHPARSFSGSRKRVALSSLTCLLPHSFSFIPFPLRGCLLRPPHFCSVM